MFGPLDPIEEPILSSRARGGRRRRLVAWAALALLVAAPVARAAVTGSLYAKSGRAVAMATYANDYAVPDLPLSIAFDGTNMWTANLAGSYSRITPTGTVTTWSTGSTVACCWAIAFDGTNMWITKNEYVVKIGPTGAVLGSYSLPAQSILQGITFDGANMWVANSKDSVSRITLAGVIADTIPLPAGSAPRAIAFDGTNVWTANGGTNSVSRVTVATRAVATFPLTGASAPNGIAFDGISIWTANGNHTVSRISLDGATTATFPLPPGSSPQGPNAIAFDQPGYAASGMIDPKTYVWTANYQGDSISKIDVVTGAVVATYPVGDGPWGLAFDGTNMWVAERIGGAVARIRVR